MTAPSNPLLAINGGPKAVDGEIPYGTYGAELIGEPEEQAVLRALRSRKLCRMTHPFEDSAVYAFEEKVRKKYGMEYFWAIHSCAAALHTALVGLGIGPGDDVLVSGAGWMSIATATINVGAVPIPVEFDESLSMDPEDLERKITSRTKAVIVVHWRGLPSNMDAILEVAKRHDIKVIEDCAQAFGGTYKGRLLGTLGDVGCYSFNMHKLISAGEGGGLYCRDPKVYRRMVTFSGMYTFFVGRADDGTKTVNVDIPMLNFRMPELCGAVLTEQIERIDHVIDHLTARRDELLAGIKDLPGLKLAPRHDPDGECGYTIPLLFDTPEQARFFTEAVRAEGVPTVADWRHSFGGGEAKGTAALVRSLGLDASTPGPMAVAHEWRTMTQHLTTNPNFDPWKWRGEPLPDLPEGVVPKTLDAIARVSALKTNMLMTSEHTAKVVAAVRKVAEAMSEG